MAQSASDSDLSDQSVAHYLSEEQSEQSEQSESNSDSEMEENEDVNLHLRERLRNWSLQNNCTRQCINSLLEILIDVGMQLPRDSRTLLHTRSDVPYVVKCGGDYIYLGIAKGIENVIQAYGYAMEEINLKFNIDGLPLFKSSSTVLWPILASFGHFKPFVVVALFCGQGKPNSVDEYLYDFIEELISLLADGIVINNVHYAVTIFSFICDAPARSWLKGIVGHSGYFSCERCTMKGKRKGPNRSTRVVFSSHENVVIKRTFERFKGNEYALADREGHCHQHTMSPLVVLDYDVVKGFALDYMHLVCLGVVRRLINFWKGKIRGTNFGKLSAGQRELISAKLVQFNGSLPSEFVRQPRSLCESDRWKATEMHSFLLYTGAVALKGILPDHGYKHFLSLVISIRFLCESSHEKRIQFLYYAQQLLEYFVYNASEHYGMLFCVYNVHGLLHLCEDVEYYRTSLDNVSAFPFENYLQALKRLVRGKHSPLVQVIKRLGELGILQINPPLQRNGKVGVGGKNSCFVTRHGIVFVKVAVG